MVVTYSHYWNCGKGIAVVAQVGPIDWLAYIGADDGDSEEACILLTLRTGVTLEPAIAKALFPQVKLPYRR